jgi:hypothetical protein
MKNAVYWGIQFQFVPHSVHITTLLHSPVGLCCARFEVFTAVTTKNAIFWDVTSCGSCKKRFFCMACIIRVERVFVCSMLQLMLTMFLAR